MSDGLVMEFDQEMAITRKVIERVPDGKLAWRPHEKSMTMGQLASHLANLPSWTLHTVNESELDIDPPGGQTWTPFSASSTADAVATFDRNVAAARGVLLSASDATLLAPWTLLKGGRKVFTIPRIACLRGFVLNHTIHHRAQLGLYLRLNDVPVPPTYGPTADEGGM